MGDIDREEARRQQPRRHVWIALRRRPAGRAFLGNGREAMVRGQDHIRVGVEPLGLQRVEQGGEIIVGVADRRERGRAIDAGNEAQQAVALIMLRAIGVARPIDENEGLVALLEQWQRRLGRDFDEIILLLDIGGQGPRLCRRTRALVGAAPRRLVGQTHGGDPRLDLIGQRDPGRGAGAVVHHDGIRNDALVAPVGEVVEDQGGAELADGRGRIALGARRTQDRFLIEVIARKMLVHVAKHRVVFKEGRHAVARAGNGKASIDRIGEIAMVAGKMAGGEARGIGHGEGREDRMAVGEGHALAHQRGHGRGGLLIDDSGTQAVGDKQHDIMRPLLRGGGRGQGEHQDQDGKTAHRGLHFPIG